MGTSILNKYYYNRKNSCQQFINRLLTGYQQGVIADLKKPGKARLEIAQLKFGNKVLMESNGKC